MLSAEQLIREILSRRDPHGYFVIPAKPEAYAIIEKYASKPGVVIVEYNDVIIVKTRSRSLAEKIARKLLHAGLLEEAPE